MQRRISQRRGTRRRFLSRSLLLVLIWLTVAFEVEAQVEIPRYAGLDVASILVKSVGEDGKTDYSIDGEKISRMIDTLKPHAQMYPVRFGNERDREGAREDVARLSKILTRVTESQQADARLVHHSATLHSMAHNMGLKDAGAEADRCFERLLEAYPENAQLKFEFGRHLFFTSRMDRGITLLEKAEALGSKSAVFSLGVAYAVRGQRDKALEYLRKHLEHNPEDTNAARMLKAVEEDRVEIPGQSRYDRS